MWIKLLNFNNYPVKEILDEKYRLSNPVTKPPPTTVNKTSVSAMICTYKYMDQVGCFSQPNEALTLPSYK